MDIHEYQSKEILADYGVPIAAMADSPTVPNKQPIAP